MCYHLYTYFSVWQSYLSSFLYCVDLWLEYFTDCLTAGLLVFVPARLQFSEIKSVWGAAEECWFICVETIWSQVNWTPRASGSIQPEVGIIKRTVAKETTYFIIKRICIIFCGFTFEIASHTFFLIPSVFCVCEVFKYICIFLIIYGSLNTPANGCKYLPKNIRLKLNFYLILG